MEEVRIETLHEDDLDQRLRRQLADIFPSRWLARPEIAARAWTQQRPAMRVVAFAAVAVGQASICVLRPEPPRVVGLGDVVVVEERRREGIGQRLLETAVSAAAQLEPELVIAASRDPTIRRVLGVHGFRNVRPHELVFRSGDLVCWNESWLVRAVGEHDMLEIAGDV